MLGWMRLGLGMRDGWKKEGHEHDSMMAPYPRRRRRRLAGRLDQTANHHDIDVVWPEV